MSIKLNILYKSSYALIIIENNSNFKIYIIEIKKLIK